MILDIIDFEGRIYVATMSGLFVSTVDELGVLTFRQIDDITALTWTLLDFKDPKLERTFFWLNGRTWRSV